MEVLLEHLQSLIVTLPLDFRKDSTLVSVPIIPDKDIAFICNEAEKIFSSEPSCLKLTSPFVIVGDIHGHLFDLVRIIQDFGLPPKKKYLFLGDLVDRGEFSIEVLLIVLIMKVLWPKNVYLIRGNHEFLALCSQGGFLQQILETYGDEELFCSFTKVFEVIPLAATLDDTTICLHGGIGPSLRSISQLSSIKRPIAQFGDDFIDSILWSDPSTEVSYFQRSQRGTGYLFGASAIDEFLKSANINRIIRAHECVMDGVQTMFNSTLYTVFSASNYCGLVPNRSGVIDVKYPGSFEIKSYSPLQYIKREEVSFISNCTLKKRQLPVSNSVRMLPMVKINDAPVQHPPISKLIGFTSKIRTRFKKSNSSNFVSKSDTFPLT